MQDIEYFETDPSHEKQAQQVKDKRLQVQQLFTGYLKSAVDARLLSGIEEEWQQAEDLFAGRDPEQSATDNSTKPINGRSRVIVNITKSKTNIAASQIIRRVLPGDMRPWKVEPTPVPEYDEAEGQGAMIKIADGTEHKATDVAKAMGVLLGQKAEKMGDQIQDWLTDTAIYRGKSAYAELRKMIKDGARVGTGVIKGPFPVSVEIRKWRTVNGVAEIQVTKKLLPRIAAKSVRNCFPDPACGDDIHRGSFFVERDYLAERQVRELKDQPGYEAAELAEVIKQGAVSYSRWDDRYKTEANGQVRVSDRNTFEVFYLYADVKVADLLQCGYQIQALTMAPGGLSEQEAAEQIKAQIDAAMQLDAVPIVATMINGRIVKVMLNPSEKGGFPYRFFRWAEVEGRPYGEGVPTQIETPQRMLTSSVRAMMENAGQSAGPITVFAKGLVTPIDGKYGVGRNKMFEFEPSQELGMDDVRKAFGLFIVPSVQEQLFNIIKAAQEWADQLANIPLLMQGITGASADTLGGMEMLEANAASPLLDIAKEYDEVVAPLISDFYDWAMQDPAVKADCKGDYQCKAIGASVLIHRDRKALAMQQVIVPMAQDPAYGLDKEKVGEEVMKSLEIEPAGMQLTEDQKQAAAQQPPPVDPRIEAAKIKAESDAAREASRRENEEQQRQFTAWLEKQKAEWASVIKNTELQIQVLESASDHDLTVEQIRATLAQAAMELRNKRELFTAERQFAMTAGDGRGL